MIVWLMTAHCTPAKTLRSAGVISFRGFCGFGTAPAVSLTIGKLYFALLAAAHAVNSAFPT